MSHGPYNKEEEKFTQVDPKGWECPKCHSIWSPNTIRCQNETCRKQFNTETVGVDVDTRQFLTED